MAVATGTRLGPYEILSALGAGGMGEVYKAKDTRLERTVAIKVLPAQLADDPQFRGRFEREAKAIAALTHPHICTLHDVGRQDGTEYLVMEFLEGETLENRLKRGALPLDQALKMAIEIASALDKAHRAGIIHRDFKPGNIMLTKAGAKLLDFGLAKSAAPVVAGAGLSILPTTPPNLTAQGTILGTFQYMAPEQLEGQEADARTDIFAFGAVVCEMLTGKKAFEGKSQASLIGAIMHAEPPPLLVLQPLTPLALDHVVRRCLAKEPDERWQSASDVTGELKWIVDPASHASTSTPSASRSRTVGLRTHVTWFAAAVAAATLTYVAVDQTRLRPSLNAEPVAFTVETRTTTRPDGFAISPDGRQVVFTALDTDGMQKLWVRSFASTTVRVLPGTDQAQVPFWSPDSREIAFFTNNELKRINVSGGAAQLICKSSGGAPVGGSWNDRNVLLFARNTRTGILRVGVSGGEPQAITTVNDTETNHSWPAFLPDGRHFIYLKTFVSAANNQLMWRAIDSPEERAVRKMYSKAFYALSGHLVFRLDGPVVAQAFDPSTGAVSGDSVQIVGDTWSNGALQTALSVSPTGVLAHRVGSGTSVAQLSWIDRQGKTLATVGPIADYRNPVVDLVGERIVANTLNPSDVWLFDGRRGTTSRLTFDSSSNSDPVFSPDGQWVAYYSARQPAGIYRKASNGTGAEELISATGRATYPRDWSLDGRYLLYDANANPDSVWVLPMDGDHKPSRFAPAPVNESQGHFSPDTRWIAYTSDETGRREVFVQSFPATGAKFQVSVAGGTLPYWRRDGRELYFLAADGRLMAVDVETKPEFRLGVPRPLFQTPSSNTIEATRRYGVSADGQRFLMNVPVAGDTIAPITVVMNWQATLKK